MWILTALLSALFAGVTSILVKLGVKNTDSDVATALRTGVVLVFAALMTLIVGSFPTISTITVKEWIFLILSGVMTGASWICYFRALSLGDVNKVAPIDKSSAPLTALIAIVVFSETHRLWLKLISIAVIFIGTVMMIEKKDVERVDGKKSWFIYAVCSAAFASLTSVFAKIGLKNVESNLGTTIRTAVVLIIAWAIVFARKKTADIKTINKKELLFILLSGIATGASWLCYYNAVKTGVLSVVVPIDKLSVLVTVAFSTIVLKEKLKPKAWVGLSLIVVFTIIMALFC